MSSLFAYFCLFALKIVKIDVLDIGYGGILKQKKIEKNKLLPLHLSIGIMHNKTI